MPSSRRSRSTGGGAATGASASSPRPSRVGGRRMKTLPRFRASGGWRSCATVWHTNSDHLLFESGNCYSVRPAGSWPIKFIWPVFVRISLNKIIGDECPQEGQQLLGAHPVRTPQTIHPQEFSAYPHVQIRIPQEVPEQLRRIEPRTTPLSHPRP